MNEEFWKERKVFVTGHTGFKGSWLALWLHKLGAKVYGYALPPVTNPDLFAIAGVEQHLSSSVIGDVRDAEALARAVQAAEPDIVIHMAAQALVRESYKEPQATYAVNVMGTVNLYEAVRKTSSVRCVINVTSDKCYENKGWIWPYRENDPFGGNDPYSSSKACSELVTQSYRHSFLADMGVRLASVRAGNVIGGGDWAADRLLPDFLRALDTGEVLTVRYPEATRPWQHVLEPLSGYLQLAERLWSDGDEYVGGWNFGPDGADARSVQWIVEYLCKCADGVRWQREIQKQPQETRALRLDSSKAVALLGWRPRWKLDTALEKTLEWHGLWKDGHNMEGVCLDQINEYERAGIA